MLSKEVSSATFWVFGMTRLEIEPRSPGPLANTLPLSHVNSLSLSLYIYIYISSSLSIYLSLSLQFSFSCHVVRRHKVYFVLDAPFQILPHILAHGQMLNLVEIPITRTRTRIDTHTRLRTDTYFFFASSFLFWLNLKTVVTL